MKKGTQLLEVYALEIQMYTEQKNNQKLKTLYEQSLHIKSAIPHPLIMGVIRGMGFPYCGGHKRYLIMGVIRGIMGVVRGIMGVVRGIMGVVRGIMGVVRGIMGVVRGIMGVIRGGHKR